MKRSTSKKKDVVREMGRSLMKELEDNNDFEEEEKDSGWDGRGYILHKGHHVSHIKN